MPVMMPGRYQFTVHTGEEILREGEWANGRTPAEASGRRPSIPRISIHWIRA
jgi:hypothetical protein